uniref:N-acetyltransferase domain-containing protein n=1 Tax=Globisporangium ultimum (strain ATCC 200006 / CBS 805.95 / DAOM BR144) TaxID=431595 RepID=K3X4Z9_GLOUD
MTLLVTRVATAEEQKIAFALRYKVFIDEFNFDGNLEVEESDAHNTTWHFLGKDVEQNKYVAAARALLDPPSRTAMISRVVLLPEYRGKGYGVALMASIENHIAKVADVFTLSALRDKKGFYERCGYQCVNDEVYLVQGAEQCKML